MNIKKLFLKHKKILLWALPALVLAAFFVLWLFLNRSDICDSENQETVMCRIIHPSFLEVDVREADRVDSIVIEEEQPVVEKVRSQKYEVRSEENVEVPSHGAAEEENEERIQDIPKGSLRDRIQDTEKVIEEGWKSSEGEEAVEEEVSETVKEEVTEKLTGDREQGAEEPVAVLPGNAVVVAVIDSGVDVTHPDLSGVVVSSWNFMNDSSEVSDELGHGTHTAGIIAKNSPTARIMALKFSDGTNGGLSELIAAIRYAVDNGADIINLSLGFRQDVQSVREVLDYANSKGVIVVAAAGNHRSDEKYYPAALDNVIGVTGLRKNGERLPTSNFGEWVDFSIVAQDVYSTAPGGTYGYRTGTSQAAALVTAVIANQLQTLKSQGDLLTAVRSYLESISEPLEGLGRRIAN